MRSPALQATLVRARTQAGRSPMTTGHVLADMLTDPDSQVSHALADLGIDPGKVQAALDAVDLADTSDASPAPQSVAITIGETTTVIVDPDVAAALQQLSTEQLRDVVKRAVDRPDPGQAAG
ncbi:MAG: Clp protease N-terminal domain-containing protein, partial [Acidimicrobiales bacterium]